MNDESIEKEVDAKSKVASSAVYRSYSTLEPHQRRVVDERIELEGRRIKLQSFFDTSLFAGLGSAEQGLLRAQHVAMKAYSDILAERIAAF